MALLPQNRGGPRDGVDDIASSREKTYMRQIDKGNRCASQQTGGTPMTMRPDPTFHASPKLAMEALPENFAYTKSHRKACAQRLELAL